MGFYYKNQSVAVRHDGLVFQCVEGTLKSRSTGGPLIGRRK